MKRRMLCGFFTGIQKKPHNSPSICKASYVAFLRGHVLRWKIRPRGRGQGCSVILDEMLKICKMVGGKFEKTEIPACVFGVKRGGDDQPVNYLDLEGEEYMRWERKFSRDIKLDFDIEGNPSVVDERVIVRQRNVMAMLLDNEAHAYLVRSRNAKLHGVGMAILVTDLAELYEYIGKATVPKRKFWNLIMYSKNLVYECTVCLRYFVAHRPAHTVIPMCRECFDQHAGKCAGDVREERVMRELTGQLSKLPDEYNTGKQLPDIAGADDPPVFAAVAVPAPPPPMEAPADCVVRRTAKGYDVIMYSDDVEITIKRGDRPVAKKRKKRRSK